MMHYMSNALTITVFTTSQVHCAQISGVKHLQDCKLYLRFFRIKGKSHLRAGYGPVSFLPSCVPDLSLYCFIVHLNTPVINKQMFRQFCINF